MTAKRNYRTESENSVSQPADDRADTPVNERALAQILEYPLQTAGTTTWRDLKIELEWSPSELEQLLDRLRAEGFIEIIGGSDRQMIVLTNRGEYWAQESR